MRLTAVIAMFTVLLGSTSALALTQISTGAAEVRAFLARSSASVYAAAYGGGLFQSADAGSTWTRIAMPANERYLTSISGNDSGIVIVGAEEGLLRSTDGNSFTKILHEPVVAVATGPGTSSIVLAGIKGLGVVRSVDAGATFTQAINSGFDSLDIVGIAFDPTDVNTVYSAARPDGQGNGGGVFRSTDGGQSWTPVPAPGSTASNNQISALVVDTTGKLYIGVLRTCIAAYWPSGNCDASGDVFSLPKGSSVWTPANAFYGVTSLHRDVNSGTTIWVGTRGLGLLSGNNTTWNYAFSQSGQPNLFYTGVNTSTSVPGSTAIIKAIKGAGIWRSATATSPRTWSHTNIPGADRVLSAAGVANSTTTMVVGLHAGGVWRTSDSGTNFVPPTVNASQADFSFAAGATAVNPFVSVWDLSASLTNANVIYAAVGGVGMFYSNDNPGLFRWNGVAWQGIGSNAPTGAPWNGVVESGLTLPSSQIYGVSLKPSSYDAGVYAGFLTDTGVLNRSGSAWAKVAVPGVTPQVRRIVPAAASSTVLALLFDDKAVVSSNAGASYTQVSASQSGFERLRFFSAAPNPINASQWVAGTNKGIFISSDGANSWTRVAMAGVFRQQAIPAVGFRSDGLTFAGDLEGNRYCSSNAGASWTLLSPKLSASVNAIRSVGSSLFYLTDGAGMYREDVTTC